MVDDAAERFRANLALADLCVAVFVRGKPEDAVVNVYRFQTVKPNPMRSESVTRSRISRSSSK